MAKGKPADTLERDLVEAVLRWLKRQGIKAKRNNSGLVRVGRRYINLGPKDWPDIIGYLPQGATFLGIECKRERGSIEITEGQEAWMEELRAAGGIAIFARSIEDVERALLVADVPF